MSWENMDFDNRVLGVKSLYIAAIKFQGVHKVCVSGGPLKKDM